MSNKSNGTAFEHELCKILANNGFWAHNLANNKNGQPADIIVARNGYAHLIDAKVLEGYNFMFRRIEENQALAMLKWKTCGNGTGWFAVKTLFGIYFLPYLEILDDIQKGVKHWGIGDMKNRGLTLEEWMERCD